jgi:hypothetical protein
MTFAGPAHEGEELERGALTKLTALLEDGKPARLAELDEAGGVLRTRTRPTLLYLLLLRQSPPVYMSIHPQGLAWSDVGRVLVLVMHDPGARPSWRRWRG